MTYGEYLGAGTATTQLLYHLNGNSADSSGNGRNGTDTNITYVAGRLGQCASFDGTSSYITLPASIPTLTAFTMSCWINTTDTAGMLYEQKITADNANIDVRIRASKLQVVLWNGSTEDVLESTVNVNTGEWVHIVITRTGANRYIYLNGISNASKTTGYTITIGGDIGAIGRHPAGAEYYAGLIDEVIVESRLWSALEIQKYYTYTVGRFGIL